MIHFTVTRYIVWSHDTIYGHMTLYLVMITKQQDTCYNVDDQGSENSDDCHSDCHSSKAEQLGGGISLC